MSFYEDRIFPFFMELATRTFRREIADLLQTADGRVLEIGAGTGANLSYYSDRVTEVVAIEPVAAMLEKARTALRHAPHDIPVSLQVADARKLPFADASFDSVVACLVFCTIPDPEQAVAEMYRVLKPGGKLIFYEHVASSRPGVRVWQHRINPVWRKLACGCEINRDTRTLFEQAGFHYRQIKDFEHPKVPSLMAPIIAGVALR
ncbi:MAG: class I SAM-dependent methyltransferase [Pseudomonadota bacterium]|nr:SAM-dependent methyltransferase [Pseudomonadales bacterium]MDY6919008.1 class I SAM-dependent methyltransferase [Pseudomonadota bacterium]